MLNAENVINFRKVNYCFTIVCLFTIYNTHVDLLYDTYFIITIVLIPTIVDMI